MLGIYNNVKQCAISSQLCWYGRLVKSSIALGIMYVYVKKTQIIRIYVERALPSCVRAPEVTENDFNI